jgi:hypothetical protein
MVTFRSLKPEEIWWWPLMLYWPEGHFLAAKARTKKLLKAIFLPEFSSGGFCAATG